MNTVNAKCKHNNMFGLKTKANTCIEEGIYLASSYIQLTVQNIYPWHTVQNIYPAYVQ